MAQLLVLKAKGLYTSPNEFSSVPEGALITANDVVIDKEGIIEPRRGFLRLLTFPINTDRAVRYFTYQDVKIAAWSDGKVGYTADDSSWTAYSGTYSDPDSNLARRRFLGANNNLYFTSSSGVYRLDAYNGSPVLAGMFKGLDIQLSLSGVTGFLATANQTAYRVVWGFRDAQNNIHYGAPSGRAVVVNTTGGSRDVSVVITIPSGVTTSHFFQIYRTKASGSASVEPDDEMGLVYENNPTSGEISAGTATVVDRTTDDLRGLALYTNPSQEGILQANERPPQADDVEEFQGCVVYANCKSKHRKIFTILACGGTGGIAFSDTITIAGTTYTAYGTEDTATLKYSLHADTTVTGDTTNGSPTVANVSSSVGLEIGRTVTGTGIPASTTILSFTATTITLSANATATNTGVTLTISTGGSPAQNIFDTAESLIRVINRNSTNTTVYAYYLSGPGDLPGQILIEERGLGGNSFALTASAHSTAFNPALPTSGTTVSSSNDDYQDMLMIAKPGKGEAVPLVNTRRVGSANHPIRRIKKLRNTLFIFKEKEGIYKMTGTSPSNFEVDTFDSSAKLIAPDSLDVVNNEIWCLCDQGITVVTETGVSVVSRPIEDLILDLYGTALDQVRYYSHGVGYETDRKYILWTVSTSGDAYATQAFVFNVFTRAYTRWALPATAAFVNPVDDKLYYSNGTTHHTNQERKSRTYADYVDYGIAVNVTSQSTKDIYLDSTADIEVGDLLYQSSSLNSVITAVQPAYVTVRDTLSWSVASATVFKGIPCEIEWVPLTGANPGTEKQFPEMAALFKQASFVDASFWFATDYSQYFEEVPIEGSRSGQWGLFAWGSGAAWGGTPGTTAIRTLVPLEKQRGSLLRVKFTHRQGYSYFKLNGLSMPIVDEQDVEVGS